MAPACQSKHTNFTKNWENHKKMKMTKNDKQNEKFSKCAGRAGLVQSLGHVGCCGWVALWCMVCELPTPGRMMGTSQRQLLRAWLAWLCVWSHWLVYGGGCFFPKWCVCPNPSSTDSLWRGCRATLQTPPINSHATLHCCSCWVSDSFYPSVAFWVASVDFDLG